MPGLVRSLGGDMKFLHVAFLQCHFIGVKMMIKKLALTGVAAVLAASFSISAMAESAYIVELQCDDSRAPAKRFKTVTDDGDDAILAAINTAKRENWCGYAFKNSPNLLDYVKSVIKE